MKKIFLAAACLCLAAPAFAQTVEQDGTGDPYSLKTELAQRVFLKYHKAIDAEMSCNNRRFSPDDKQAMEDVINGRVAANSPDATIGAARLLTLTGVAEDQTDKLISDEGCDGDHVKKLLQFFDDRLASAASAPPANSASPAAAQTEDAPQSLAPQAQ